MTRAAGRVLLAAAAAAVLVLATFMRAQSPPPPSLGSTVGQWWKMLGRDLIRLAEAMPEDKFNFKPTTGEFKTVRTFGEQLKHAACANEAFMLEIEHKEPPADCETGGSEPGQNESRDRAVPASVFRASGLGGGRTHAGQRARSGRRPLRRPEHAPRAHHPCRLARRRPLRAARGVSPHERNRSARESVIRKRKTKRSPAKGPPTLRSIC